MVSLGVGWAVRTFAGNAAEQAATRLQSRFCSRSLHPGILMCLSNTAFPFFCLLRLVGVGQDGLTISRGMRRAKTRGLLDRGLDGTAVWRLWHALYGADRTRESRNGGRGREGNESDHGQRARQCSAVVVRRRVQTHSWLSGRARLGPDWVRRTLLSAAEKTRCDQASHDSGRHKGAFAIHNKMPICVHMLDTFIHRFLLAPLQPPKQPPPTLDGQPTLPVTLHARFHGRAATRPPESQLPVRCTITVPSLAAALLEPNTGTLQGREVPRPSCFFLLYKHQAYLRSI